MLPSHHCGAKARFMRIHRSRLESAFNCRMLVKNLSLFISTTAQELCVVQCAIVVFLYKVAMMAMP